MSYTNLRKTPNPLAPTPTRIIPDELAGQLGSGLAFSPIYNNNSWFISDGVEKVKQSMTCILLTPIGCRLDQPDFGSMIPFLVFERENTVLAKELDLYTRQALNRWEPRITVINTKVDFGESAASIGVFFKVNGTAATEFLNVPIFYNTPAGTFENPSTFTVGGKQILHP
jgi:phage baseplate assembly protein W